MLATLSRSLLASVILGTALAVSPVEAGTKTLPFRASYGGSFEPTVLDGDPGYLVVAEGQATWLGHFRAEQSHKLGPGPLEFSDGHYTFTGANGDTISGRYWGTITPLTDLPGAVTFHGTWTIDGGTGRLEGASGGGTALGVGLSNLTFTLKLVGEIAIPA